MFKKEVMKKWEQCQKKQKIVLLTMKKCQITKIIMGKGEKENP